MASDESEEESFSKEDNSFDQDQSLIFSNDLTISSLNASNGSGESRLTFREDDRTKDEEKKSL